MCYQFPSVLWHCWLGDRKGILYEGCWNGIFTGGSLFWCIANKLVIYFFTVFCGCHTVQHWYDSRMQVMLINAAKDVASALSHLINSAKNASGKQGNDRAVDVLKESAKVISVPYCSVQLGISTSKIFAPIGKLNVGLLVVMIWLELCTTYSTCTFPAVPRSTQPSTLRGTVNEYQLFGLSNNNKWRWWL